ncbi:MAG: alpha/beta hydrolase, partial [Candidatus Eremiobacteraeota bacterium]|nr:alpha/beta hydrolase [Candidatus Eremiobacteraeota bacterium]
GIVLIAPVPPSGLALPPKADEIFRSTAGNRTNFARWLKRQSLAPLPEEQFSALVEAAATIRPEVAIESYESWTHLDFADAARGITTPTLVLPGEADSPNLTPERLTETVLSLVRNSQMTVIERCGHYVPLEQPEAAAAAIHRFARELPYDQLPG